MSQFDAFVSVDTAQFYPKSIDSFINTEGGHVPPVAHDALISADLLLSAPAPAPTTSRYSDAVLADLPALYLKCQESSGTTLTDSSGNSRHATISATGVNLRSGSELPGPDGLGHHISLDGLTGFITLPSSNWLTANTTGFSVEMWIRVKEYKNNSKIFDFSNAASNDLWSGFSSAPRMLSFGTSSTHTSPNVPDLGEWHHYAYTYSPSGEMRTYINGSLFASTTLGTVQVSPRQFKYIGRSNLVTNTNYLSASVSHIAVYNGVLTSGQITNHVRAAGTATDDLYNLVFSDRPWGYWPLNEGPAETTFMDHSPIPTRVMNLSGSLTAVNEPGPKPGSYAITFPNNNTAQLVSSVNPSTQAFTMEAWVRFASTPASNCSIMSSSSSPSGTNTADSGLWISTNGRINFSVFTNTWTTITSPSALATNTWHHIVATYSPTGAMTVRVNKSDVATAVKAPLAAPYTRPIRIRGGYSHAGGVITVSNPAWYKGALPAATTDAHYDSTVFFDVGGTQLTGITLQPFAGGVTGYWRKPMAGESFEYRIDGGTPVALSSADPFFISTSVPTGTHTFEVRSKVGSIYSDWSAPRTFTSQQSQTFLREIFKDNPTMYVPLDATQGDYESWPRGNKWTAISGANRARPPITRNSTYAASGSGTSGIASIQNAPVPVDEETVEVWIRMPASGKATGTILQLGGGTGTNWTLDILPTGELGYYKSTSNVQTAVNGLGYVFPSDTGTATNYHIAITRLEGTATFYVNGRMVGIDGSGATGTHVGNYRIGSRHTDSISPLSSTVHVDSVSFYDYRLSPLRIMEHCRAGHQLTMQSNTSVYPLNGGVFTMHDTHPAALYTEISIDNGSTYLTPSYKDTVLEDHPDLYYRLDETTGTTAYDSGSRALHATYEGSYSLGQAGALHANLPDTNNALYTPGSGGVILPDTLFPTPPGTPNNGYWISGEAWIKPDDVTGTQTIMGKANHHLPYNATNYAWSLHMIDGYLEFGIWQGFSAATAITDTRTPIQPGVWTHVAFCNDRDSFSLMVNGVTIARRMQSTSPSSTSTAPFRIGTSSMSERNFRGYIDEVAYYNYALSPEQATRHYVVGSLGKFYTWTQIPQLDNDETVSVRARIGNPYMTSPALSPAVNTTPSADRYVTLVEKFHGAPRRALGHAPYAPSAWVPDVYATTIGLNGSGTAYFVSNSLDSFMSVPGTVEVDMQAKVKYATTNATRSCALVVRHISSANTARFRRTSLQTTYRAGTADSLTVQTVPKDGETLRVFTRGNQIYYYQDDNLILIGDDYTYSNTSNYPPSNTTLSQGIYLSGMDQDKYSQIIMWNKAPDDLEIVYPGVGNDAYLYKGRVSRALDEPTYEP